MGQMGTNSVPQSTDKDFPLANRIFWEECPKVKLSVMPFFYFEVIYSR